MSLKIIGRKLAPPRRVKLRAPVKVVDDFYNSPEWRALIAGIIQHRGRHCEDPRHDRSKPNGRVFGDHIIELRDGGRPLDPSNILLRCGCCHTRKTAAARANRYYRGVSKKGDRPSTYNPNPRHAGEIFGSGEP